MFSKTKQKGVSCNVATARSLSVCVKTENFESEDIFFLKYWITEIQRTQFFSPLQIDEIFMPRLEIFSACNVKEEQFQKKIAQKIRENVGG